MSTAKRAPRPTSTRIADDTVRGSVAGTRRSASKTAAVSTKQPVSMASQGVDALSDGGDPIAIQPHFGGIVQIEPVRGAIDQQPPGFELACRSFVEQRQNRLSVDVIDHLQEEPGRRERFGREQRVTIGRGRIRSLDEPDRERGAAALRLPREPGRPRSR